jgi:hypothetical protein
VDLGTLEGFGAFAEGTAKGLELGGNMFLDFPGQQSQSKNKRKRQREPSIFDF